MESVVPRKRESCRDAHDGHEPTWSCQWHIAAQAVITGSGRGGFVAGLAAAAGQEHEQQRDQT